MYLNRREFFGAATASVGTAILGVRTVSAAGRPAAHGARLDGVRKSRFSSSDVPTPWNQITSYNNFYEFAGSDNKDLPSRLAPANLVTSPWTVTVEGACARPGKYSLDEVLKDQPLEERIYRHRCVEGWSMVIPWIGEIGRASCRERV